LLKGLAALDSCPAAHHIDLINRYPKIDEAVAALPPEQFRVTRQNSIERPGTGPLLKNKEAGRVSERLLSYSYETACWDEGESWANQATAFTRD